MKLIPAGILEGDVLSLKDSYLFNCTRNPACQKEFFIPIPEISAFMQFYADLPGNPDTYAIIMVDCNNDGTSVVANQQVLGTKPDGSYYTVFGDLAPAGPVPDTFFLFFIFSIGGSNYVFFTNYFRIARAGCDRLTLLQACYPNEKIGADASDCNGVYYGFPNDTGDLSYRYFHWAYVRDAEVEEQKNTLAMSLFNSRKPYKNTFNRETLFQCELMPKFYKDVIIGIANRGIMKIDGIDWTLSENNEVSLLDKDSKLWAVDILLGEQCLQYFGCGQADCELPTPPEEECCSPTDVEGDITEGIIPECCSPDIESTHLEVSDPGGSSVPVEPCCDPTITGAVSEILGDFLIEHEMATEGGVSVDFQFQTTAGQTGTIYWGDGSSEPFDSGTGTFDLTHTFPRSGIYRQKIFFDANSLINFFITDLGSASAIDFSHSDNFTNFKGAVLTGVLDINDVLPPTLSNLEQVSYEAHFASEQTTMDFTGVFNSHVKYLYVRNFPALTSISNVPSTVSSWIQLLGNPLLTSFGTLSAIQQYVITNNAVSAASIAGLNFSTVVQIQAGQNFTSSEVDSILAALVASGRHGGQAVLNQSPAAPPGPSGVTDAATLTSRGWFVITD